MKKLMLIPALFAVAPLTAVLASQAESAAPSPPANTWVEQGPAEPPPPELLPPQSAPAAAPVPAQSVASTPTPVPVSAPAPVPVPMPGSTSAPAPVPVAPTAAPLTSAPVVVAPAVKPPSAAVKEGTVLRTRPTANGSDEQTLGAGTQVHLVSQVTNGSGVWWFATAPGVGGGWLRESELGPITR